ncbi:hypothetical protein ACFVVC_02120 [Pseudarthrobacter sp. NPDC058196]|uniref:hypothetical protein n=1 Tax=Pseudarthrobacter sp. NPDC058196 TaxID=3346376 RepID=UPI0036D8DA65
MTNTGIFTQSADSVLQDVDEFYFGGALPWYHGSKLTEDGSRVLVTLDDPEADDESQTKDYELSASQIKEAFRKAKGKGYNLCCTADIESEQLGFGCVQDLDIILQTACYGELVFG